MNLTSLSENHNIEKRIAITPEIAKKYISLGFNLTLQNNYGTHLGFSDEDYKNLGVKLLDNEEEIIKNSQIIIQLGLPDKEKLSKFVENQILIGSLNAFLNKDKLDTLKSKKVNFFQLRLKNETDKNLIIVEVQTGSYLGEDDIIRIEDDFKR